MGYGKTFIEVPRERWPWTPYDAPPERITLPLAARARMGLLGWLLGYLSPLGLIGAVLIPMAFFQTFATATVKDLIVLAVSWPFFIAIAFSTSTLLTLIVDRVSSSPRLVIDEEGLTDRRALDAVIPWSEIAHAKIIYGRGVIAAVRLKLRHAVGARHNPFRVGTLFRCWRRRPDELRVPVMNLNVRDRTLGLVIIRMVKLRGGTIDTKPPFPGPLPPELEATAL